MLLKLPKPSLPLAEERVDKRSDVRVSKYTGSINANSLTPHSSQSQHLMISNYAQRIFESLLLNIVR
jgi:hypothetical protein